MTALWTRLRRALACPAFAAVLAVGLIVVTLAYQFDTPHSVQVGGYYDRVYVQGFHERESAEEEPFRWTTARATVLFPGVGAGDRWLVVRLHGWRPPGQPSPDLRISVSGHLLATVTAAPPRGQTGLWYEYRLWVPAQAADGGTLRVTLETEPFVPAEAGSGDDVRPLGVAVNLVALLPPERGRFSPGWPALDQLGWALLLAAALYLGLATVGLPRWGAALAAGLALAALGWGLALHRLWTTIYTPRLAIVAALGLLLLPAIGWLFGRVFAWAKVPFGDGEMRLLLAVFLVGFWLKAGGLLYPFSVAIDLKWHLEKSAWILNGRLAELYRPGAFSESVMPAEWGEDKPLIPYSPFYHLTAVAFFAFPWRPYDTANVVSVLLDTTRPFLIYLLACRLGLGRRVGLWAGLLYALLPATFLLHSWGNVPTTTGIWWTLASTCYIIGAWERLSHPRTWAGLAFFLLGAMLYYTTLAVFMVVFLAILLVGLQLGGKGLAVRPGKAVLWALVAAIGLSTAVYYGQYASPMFRETIPHFIDSLRRGGTGLGTEPVSWPEYIRATLTRMGSLRYGLLWPTLLALGGLFVGRRHLRRPLVRWTLVAWFATAFLFFLVGFRVDMVDKELWYAMPAVALCAAMVLDWLWSRWLAGRMLTVVTFLFLAAAALQTWVFRLSSVRQDWFATDAPIVGEKLGPLLAVARWVLFRG